MEEESIVSSENQTLVGGVAMVIHYLDINKKWSLDEAIKLF